MAGGGPEEFFSSPYPPGTEPVPPRFVPESLDVFMRQEMPQPELIDGLLYPGKLHSLTGPPEAGKSVLCLHWAIQVMNLGGNVLLVDEESGPVQVAALLSALGADPELTAKRLSYLPFPAASWRGMDLTALDELVTALRPKLTIFDSCAAVMSAAQWDENSAGDTTRFISTVLLPLARNHHCSVVLIDHDNKSTEQGRYGRGSSAKLAAVDVALKVSPLRPFSRQQDGVLKLSVVKDRSGWLHRSWRVRVGHQPLRLDFVRDVDVKPREDMSPAAAKLASVLTDEPADLKVLVDRIAAHYGHGLRWVEARKELGQLCALGIADAITEPGIEAWMRAGVPRPANMTWRPTGA